MDVLQNDSHHVPSIHGGIAEHQQSINRASTEHQQSINREFSHVFFVRAEWRSNLHRPSSQRGQKEPHVWQMVQTRHNAGANRASLPALGNQSIRKASRQSIRKASRQSIHRGINRSITLDKKHLIEDSATCSTG
jgi:hypothetical protein